MRATLLTLLASGFLLAAPALAQEQDHRPGRHADPAERVARMRAELGLSDQQVARLEGIFQELRERNRPLGERLREAMPKRQPGAAARRRGEVPDEVRNLRQQLRENRRQAMQEVREVMTREQLERLREKRGEQRQRLPRKRRPAGT